jgi:hypothetical protein
MAEIRHKVIGAGESDTNPIIVNLDCETSAGTISWVGREILSGDCGCNKYYDNRYYTEISGETGYVKTHTWEDATVYYKSKLDCPSEEDETCSEYFCSDLSAYAVPSHVKEGFSGTIEIHYDYFLTSVNEHEKICSREKITGVDVIKYPDDIANNSYTFKVCNDCPCSGSQKTIFFTTYKDDGTCTEKTTIELSVYTSTNEVSWKKETISVIYSFVKTKTNEDCTTKKTSGSISENWEIPQCVPKELDEKYCCKDNIITSGITVDNVIRKLGFTPDEYNTIMYNGEDVDTGTTIEYSVVQKAKTTGECQSTCENKTTYCVDSGSVKVYYNVNGKWVIEDDPSEPVVPEEGGKDMIKLTFSGTVTTILSDCSAYTSDFSREIKFDVPHCDIKKTSAPYVYYFEDNKITYNYKQQCKGCHTITPTEGGCNSMPKFSATTAPL